MLARGVIAIALSGCSLAFTNAPKPPSRICTSEYMPVIADTVIAIPTLALGAWFTYITVAEQTDDQGHAALAVALPALVIGGAFAVAAGWGAHNIRAYHTTLTP